MLFKRFIKEESNFPRLLPALSTLHGLNMYAVLMDLAASKMEGYRAANRDKDAVVEAARAGWHDGYVEALRDLFEFEQYKPRAKTTLPDPGFGGLDDAVKRGDLTDDERRTIIQSRK